MKRAYLVSFGLAFGVLTASLFLFAGLTDRFGTMSSGGTSNIDRSIALYGEIGLIEPSETAAAEVDDIVRARLVCYKQSPRPLDRVHDCNSAYTKAIIRVTRQHIRSMPELGQFIGAVQACPIVHSMCIGSNNDTERCTRMERQCIDAKLDQYWRGATPPLTRD